MRCSLNSIVVLAHTQGNKTLPHALLTQFNRRTGPQTQGNKTLPHALLTPSADPGFPVRGGGRI